MLLFFRQQRPPELGARVREGALGAALAGVHVREVAAEAPLVHGLGEGPLRVGRLCLF